MANGSDEERKSAASRGWTVEGPTDAGPEENAAATSAGGADAMAFAGASGDVDRPGESADEGGEGAVATDSSSQMSNLTVVMLGVTGGLFLLYGWVWMSWTQYYSAVNEATAAGSGSLGGVLQQIVYWVAPLAPVLWFISALALHLKEPKKLALAIFFGLVVTFPLPMVLTNGAAL